MSVCTFPDELRLPEGRHERGSVDRQPASGFADLQLPSGPGSHLGRFNHANNVINFCVP